MTLFDIYMFQQLFVTNTSRTIMTGISFNVNILIDEGQGQFENHIWNRTFSLKLLFRKEDF